MVTIILAMVSITWLFGKNRALVKLLEKEKVKHAWHVDWVFDLQQENAVLLEEIMTLQTDNSILGSCCANGGLNVDTSFVQ